MRTALVLLSLVLPPSATDQAVVSAPAMSAPLRMPYEPTQEEFEAADSAPVVLAEATKEVR